MSDTLGPVALADLENPYLSGDAHGVGVSRPFSESTAQMVDAEVRLILEEGYEEAMRLLASDNKRVVRG